MACIVKYKSPSGRTYAYRSESKWDAEKGYSVPTRTYLGRVDDITGEIIPSSKKRGRPPDRGAAPIPDGSSDSDQSSELTLLKEKVEQLSKQVESLLSQKERSKRELQNLQRQLGSVLSDM